MNQYTHGRSRLLSNRVITTAPGNVTLDRYQYLDLSSAEPNLGVSANGNVLTTTIYGDRIWSNTLTISSLTANIGITGNLTADTITPYQTPVTIFNNTVAVGLPVGSTAQRSAAATGYIRYNTDYASPEYYNGSAWIPLTSSITDQIITPNGTSQSFTLNQSATTAGVIVSINGTVQQPGTSYTVAGTTITFTEIPLVSDIIDVRFIASTVLSINVSSSTVNTGNVAVGLTATIIDSIDTSLYRSARYSISSTNPYDSQFAQVMLLQRAGVATVTAFGILNTGGNSVTYSANVSGNTAYLLATGTTSSNQLRIEKTYYTV
jgi:hypothetical protein